MNEVCDTWNTAWVTLQKALAQAEAHDSRLQSGVLGASSWLGRARDRAAGAPLWGPEAAPLKLEARSESPVAGRRSPAARSGRSREIANP
jgi:hypothetical protein